ncbi:unnamed protein product, partial [Ixodes pacificus]
CSGRGVVTVSEHAQFPGCLSRVQTAPVSYKYLPQWQVAGVLPQKVGMDGDFSEVEDTSSSSTESSHHNYKILERRIYRHNTARKRGRHLRIKETRSTEETRTCLSNQQAFAGIFASRNMGLKSVDRPPTPSLFGNPAMSLVSVLGDPSVNVEHFVRPASCRVGRAANFSPSPVKAAAAAAAASPVPLKGIPGEPKAERRPAPRLSSPTAERHLASLLQQLRRER